MNNHTTNGSPRCRANIEPPTGSGPCVQCSRTASYVLDRDPSCAVQVCHQHARSYDRPMTDAERVARSR